MTTPPDTWADSLLKDGRQALLDLLSGTASLGRLSASEPEDAASDMLGSLRPDTELVRSFDAACLAVLNEFRTGILKLEGSEFIVALNRLDTLVSIVRRLLPETTVLDFHQKFVIWNGFFENFVIDRGLDLRREYFRILALTQDTAESVGLAPRRLMPLWLSICAESGGSGLYDKSYLRVALLGLRRLPLCEEFSANEDFALHGLARWAVSRNPDRAAFMREWRVLEGDFPRDAGFWMGHVQQAVTAAERELSERTRGVRDTFPAAAWWREDVDLAPTDRSPVGRGSTEPPAREERERVLRDIGHKYVGLAPRVDVLMRGHQRYADNTGDVFYLVRTACNVGMNLINKGEASECQARGAHAVSLARLAFEYDPTNVFAWSLMRDALAAAGRVSDAELVGWESIRRFPENCQWPTQLAPILAGPLGKPEEAAALLSDTMTLFSADPYSRNQLATILADYLGDRERAGQVLRTAIADGAADDATRSLLAKLEQAQPLHRQKQPIQSKIGTDESSMSLPTAAARRLLFKFEAGLVDREAVRAFLSSEPSESYLTYVGERTGVTDLPLKTTFALAFDQALREASPSALRGLISRARPIERPLIEEAIALSEGRVISLAGFSDDLSGDDRYQRLNEVLERTAGASNERMTTLLRDVSASFLSMNTASMALA